MSRDEVIEGARPRSDALTMTERGERDEVVEAVKVELARHGLRWEKVLPGWRYWCECGHEFPVWREAARDYRDHVPTAVLDAALAAGCVLPGTTKPSLFQSGEFTLHSGGTSSFKIDCDALTDLDLATLAAQVAERFQWGSVYGIPRGGTRFAAALAQHNQSGDLPRLLVDDVYTTGQSMDAHRQPRDIGVVIFTRAATPKWIVPVFILRGADDALDT